MAPAAFSRPEDLNRFVEVREGLHLHCCTTVWNTEWGYIARLPVSAFLVRHKTKPHDWALIDTCAPNEFSILMNAIHEFLTHAQDRIRYICITHAHYDHTGGVRALLDRYPDSKVVIHVEEKPFACDGHYLHKANVRVPYDRTITLRDGDQWEFEDVLEFVETSGHTPGSTSFIHLSSKSVMVGNAVMNYLNVSGPTPASTWHWGDAMKAIDKILSLEDRVEIVFPAHDVGQSGVHITRVRDFRRPS
ncbi:hypothetical protein BG006_004350 [Podila minutissima]|uniref:Metallo-beta-lactamase domain-containing protein n=1 Tax=Podila minutissima TaxID=64525 RepID=A0A9P5VQW9_9FUNG|nr:hypothetical protein BG006_004350 [Podila minutissima]